MAFAMKLDNKALQGQEVMPQGIYELRLTGFKPATSKAGDSVNLNPSFEVVNNADPELNGRKIYDSLSFKAGWTHLAFCNALGMDMETDGTSSWLPGDWDGDKGKFKEDDPATWVYAGPLLNRTCAVELNISSYNGKNSNKIEKYFVKEGFTPRPL